MNLRAIAPIGTAASVLLLVYWKRVRPWHIGWGYATGVRRYASA